MNRAEVLTGITPTLPQDGHGGVVGFFFRGDNGARRFRVAIRGTQLYVAIYSPSISAVKNRATRPFGRILAQCH